MTDDIARYRKLLAPIERAAADLPWADQRRWRAKTHIAWDADLPVVDLHNLSAALAREVVQRLLDAPPDTGAVVLVHGKGKHSTGGGVLRGVVQAELRAACGANRGWRYRALGPARLVWISDWSKAPAAATGGRWGCAWWLAGALFAVAFAAAIARALGFLG